MLSKAAGNRMIRWEDQRAKVRFILHFYGSGFGFCSVPGSGSSLVRKTSRGLENLDTEGGCARQPEASWDRPLTQPGETSTDCPQGDSWTENWAYPLARGKVICLSSRNNQRLSSCRTPATHTQNLKATTATPNNLPYTIRWSFTQTGAGLGWPILFTMPWEQGCHESCNSRCSCRCRINGFDWLCYGLSCHLGKKRKEEDSNIFILNHSLIMKWKSLSRV